MSSITRIPKHVQTAATEGMRAGLDAFERVASKGGLGIWDDYAVLNAKRRFVLYCATYGPIVDSLQAPTSIRTYSRSSGRVKNAVAAPIQEDRKMTAKQQIAELEAQIEALKAAPVKTSVERTVTPADPKAPVTYKQAMTLRFRCGLTKAAVAKLNQGQASKKIAAFYASV